LKGNPPLFSGGLPFVPPTPRMIVKTMIRANTFYPVKQDD